MRENTNLDLDRPCEIALELTHGGESLQPDARVDLDVGAHAHRALKNGLFQRAAAALIDVVLAELTLGRRHLGDRLAERALPQFAAIENAGFVEMNMRLDEARDDKSSANVFLRRVRRDSRCHLDDVSAGDGDIDDLRLMSGDTGIAQNEIEGHGDALGWKSGLVQSLKRADAAEPAD